MKVELLQADQRLHPGLIRVGVNVAINLQPAPGNLKLPHHRDIQTRHSTRLWKRFDSVSITRARRIGSARAITSRNHYKRAGQQNAQADPGQCPCPSVSPLRYSLAGDFHDFPPPLLDQVIPPRKSIP